MTEEKQKPLIETLITKENGHAVVSENGVLTVYERHDDGSLTEVWQGSLYSALRKLAQTGWFS